MQENEPAQVPRSARLIKEDNEYALFSFILFRKIVDSFKSEARQKGWQVRTSALSLHLMSTECMYRQSLAYLKGQGKRAGILRLGLAPWHT